MLHLLVQSKYTAWLTIVAVYFHDCSGAPAVPYVSLVTCLLFLTSNLLSTTWTEKLNKWWKFFLVFTPMASEVAGLVVVCYYITAFQKDQLACHPALFIFSSVMYFAFVALLWLTALFYTCQLAATKYLASHPAVAAAV
jgi:hypothetical protein